MFIQTERFAPRFILRIKSILSITGINPKKFLEVGFGIGEFLQLLEKLGWKGDAIEVSEKAFKIAEQKLSTNQVKLHNNLDGINKSEKYDFIFLLDVLEHIKDDKQFLKELIIYMNRGTKIVVSVPAHARGWTKHDELAGHYRRYEKKELHQLFESTGLTVEFVINYGFPIINVTNIIRGLIAKKDSRLKLSTNQRIQSSGLNKWNKIGRFKGFFLQVIIFFSYYFQKLFWKFDLGDGYIIQASIPNQPNATKFLHHLKT